MPHRDLRAFLAVLEEHGELTRVSGASWDLEIGTLAELNYERAGPALLFDGIPDHPRGFRVLTNSMDNRRTALAALDLPLDLDLDEAIHAYEDKISSYSPVPPELVDGGPVTENAFEGPAIDLLKFPAPFWHENDGGRYLGTGCTVIMRDPDSGRVNLGTYRVMVHDETTLGLYISPSHNGAIIQNKYWSRGLACPVAVSFGQEPVIFLGAAPYLGQKRDLAKYDLMGHVRGAPVEVMEEPLTGLPVPAASEILVAGEVPPPSVESRPEGPFGEWTGYYGTGRQSAPVIRVQALYHRDDPIIMGQPPVKYRHAPAHFAIPTLSANDKERVIKSGVDDVLDVWRLAVPGVTVVQIKQRYPGHAMKAGLAASGEYMGRFVIVVDEDIDPRDPRDVLWAIGSRCDPQTTMTVLTGCQSSALDPRLPPDQKARGDFTSSRAIINACKPFEWMDEFPAVNVASAELRQRVFADWGERVWAGNGVDADDHRTMTGQ
jgi:4-hydroxy-3-polyprenylbenzoate decarboxylase